MMMKSFKLRHKIAGLALTAALLPVLVMSLLIDLKKDAITTVTESEMRTMIEENLAQIARDVYHMCEVSHQLVQKKVACDLMVARRVLDDDGGVAWSKDETVTWRAVNQFSKEENLETLPKMLVGGRWLGKNRNLDVPTPVVDDIKKMVGGTCTIFQRMNERGDMLRVATNVETLDGKRAIGTYIPAIRDDGKPDPVVSTLLKGGTFWGRAYVVNAWYITAYSPLKNETGEIIGAVYVGVKQEAVQSLRKAVMDIQVGKTGYVWVVGSKGDQKGRYVISKNGELDGENIWESKSGDDFFIQDIVNGAVAKGGGEVGFKAYPWKNPGEKDPREKVAAYIYFEPWEWVICPAVYVDDYDAAKHQFEHSLTSLISQVWVGGVIILIIVGAAACYLGRKIAAPISRVAEIAQIIAGGDLVEARSTMEALSGTMKLKEEVASDGDQSETNRLVGAVKSMIGNLNSLVGQVQKSCIQLVSASTQIAASSKQQESTVSEFGASTNQVVASSKEISTTSKQLAETMNEVSIVSSETSSLADAGRAELQNMERTMRGLAEATRSISSKLSIINEKAGNITNVVTTITKVADQTNLLSLNAAIEAEKAGEYGLGFAVVAREIRGLADQTAVATLDIEKMVDDMEGSVSSGVMEMDNFSERVRSCVQEVVNISGKLETIIERVKSLPPRFESVTEGMRGQAEGAGQISEAMVQLNEAAAQTSDSLREFNEATQQLNETAQAMQREVSIFKVS